MRGTIMLTVKEDVSRTEPFERRRVRRKPESQTISSSASIFDLLDPCHQEILAPFMGAVTVEYRQKLASAVRRISGNAREALLQFMTSSLQQGDETHGIHECKSLIDSLHPLSQEEADFFLLILRQELHGADEFVSLLEQPSSLRTNFVQMAIGMSRSDRKEIFRCKRDACMPISRLLGLFKDHEESIVSDAFGHCPVCEWNIFIRKMQVRNSNSSTRMAKERMDEWKAKASCPGNIKMFAFERSGCSLQIAFSEAAKAFLCTDVKIPRLVDMDRVCASCSREIHDFVADSESRCHCRKFEIELADWWQNEKRRADVLGVKQAIRRAVENARLRKIEASLSCYQDQQSCNSRVIPGILTTQMASHPKWEGFWEKLNESRLKTKRLFCILQTECIGTDSLESVESLVSGGVLPPSFTPASKDELMDWRLTLCKSMTEYEMKEQYRQQKSQQERECEMVKLRNRVDYLLESFANAHEVERRRRQELHARRLAERAADKMWRRQERLRAAEEEAKRRAALAAKEASMRRAERHVMVQELQQMTLAEEEQRASGDCFWGLIYSAWRSRRFEMLRRERLELLMIERHAMMAALKEVSPRQGEDPATILRLRPELLPAA